MKVLLSTPLSDNESSLEIVDVGIEPQSRWFEKKEVIQNVLLCKACADKTACGSDTICLDTGEKSTNWMSYDVGHTSWCTEPFNWHSVSTVYNDRKRGKMMFVKCVNGAAVSCTDRDARLISMLLDARRSGLQYCGTLMCEII
jgi:hypothetical protein